MAIVRGLIERITLTPGEDGGLAVVLHGDLARIMQLCEAGERIIGGCGGLLWTLFPVGCTAAFTEPLAIVTRSCVRVLHLVGIHGRFT
jgi:hypothetical protein